MTQTMEGVSRDHRHSRRQKGPIIAAVGPTGGESVLRMARTVAALDSADALVVSVVSPPTVYAIDISQPMLNTWPIEEFRVERRHTVHNRLHEIGPWLPWREEPDIEIAYGEARTLIADIADERDARLIVVGKGPHQLRDRLFGAETALGTIRRVHCPVLAVSEEAHALPRVVVVAMDFSPASVHAAAEALPLVADGAVIHFVHTWSRIQTPVPMSTLRDVDDAYARSLPERFERMRTALGPSHPLVFTTVVREGPPAQTLLDFARAVSADLIVAGSRGFGMLDRLIVGSVSTALLRGSGCSVLIVPGPQGVERARLERHMTGSATVNASAEWAHELEALAQRNQFRRTSLEIDDRSLDTQVQESGYALTGATYDPHDRHVELMFARPGRLDEHLTRRIGDVRNLATMCNTDDVDTQVCIETTHGFALLTFLADQPEEAI